MHQINTVLTLGKPTWGKNPTILSLENKFNKIYQSNRQTDQHDSKMIVQKVLRGSSTKFQVKLSTNYPQMLLVKVYCRCLLGMNFGLFLYHKKLTLHLKNFRFHLIKSTKKLGLISAFCSHLSEGR